MQTTREKVVTLGARVALDTVYKPTNSAASTREELCEARLWLQFVVEGIYSDSYDSKAGTHHNLPRIEIYGKAVEDVQALKQAVSQGYSQSWPSSSLRYHFTACP